MDARMYMDEAFDLSCVSTGHLPAAELVKTLLREGHERFKLVNEGQVADYIPALAKTPRRRATPSNRLEDAPAR